LFCSIFFSYDEKATVALYFGQALTHLGVADFQIFRLILCSFPVNLLLVLSHQAEDIYHKSNLFKDATVWQRRKLNQDHVIIITVAIKMGLEPSRPCTNWSGKTR